MWKTVETFIGRINLNFILYHSLPFYFLRFAVSVAEPIILNPPFSFHENNFPKLFPEIESLPLTCKKNWMTFGGCVEICFSAGRMEN